MSESAREAMLAGKERYYAPIMARVTAINDPKRKHRVKVEIPNLISETDWARPVFNGVSQCPKVGDYVMVLLYGGDPQSHVFHLGTFWSEEEGDNADALEGLTPEQAPLVHSVIDVGKYTIAVSEVEGARQLVIQDRVSGDMVRLDGTNGVIDIKASTLLKLECDGDVIISGTAVKIMGRLVMPDSKPI